MTEQEFLALPDRKKNALAYLHLGLDTYQCPRCGGRMFGSKTEGGEITERYCHERNCSWAGTPEKSQGDYLTWEGAGMIVEKMREEGWAFKMDISGLICFVQFGAGPDLEAADNSAPLAIPLAICLAALKAKGVIEC